MNKPKLKYLVSEGKKPGTEIAVYRPVLTERTTYYTDQVVEYALNAGYVRGQFEDMKGALNGFISAIQSLGKAGICVSLSNWLRIHAEMLGSCDALGTLTAANALKVCITALTDLKVNKDEFTLENVSVPKNLVKVDGITAEDGTVNWVVVKNKGIVVSGKNLKFVYADGDRVTVSYDGLSTPINLVPTKSAYASMQFDWPTALAELDDGTPLNFTFTLHVGAETAQVVEKVAAFKA